MPGKKLKTNSRATAARERKAEAKAAKKQSAKREAESAQWADEGNSAKERKKREAERKRQEQLAKKDAIRKLKQAEEAKLEAERRRKNFKHTSKITAAQVAARNEEKQKLLEAQRASEEAEKQKLIFASEELEENTNIQLRQQQLEDLERFGEGNVVTAADVDTALQSLDDSKSGNKQKGPKMKELFMKFSDRRMAELKAQGGMKLSQMKDLIWKEWQRSPDNPKRSR